MKISSTSHVLTTLGILFLAGGMLRLIPTAAADPEALAIKDSISEPPPELPSLADTGSRLLCDPALTEILASDIEARNSSIEALRIQTLELQAREQDLTQREAEMEALRDMLESQWEDLQATANEDISHLAAMYGAMKADDAARIFDQMEPAFAAGFLREIPGEAAGQILAEMDPDRAYRISIMIAARGAEVRIAQTP